MEKEEENNNEYDIVIDIDSIRSLNKKGWKIEYIKDKNKLKSIIEEKKKSYSINFRKFK